MDKRNLHLPAIMLGVGLLAIPTTQLQAAEWPDRVSLAGFMSSVYSKTDFEYPYNGNLDEAGIDDKGSFKGTRVGLNMSARITNKVSLASQFFASREEEGFNSHFDWSFISYGVNDVSTVRAGRIKFPIGLVNEYIDVGVAYPWIAAPQFFYGEEKTGPLATTEAYNGLSLLFEGSNDDWTFAADLFAGEAPGETWGMRELTGLTVTADWDDTILIKAGTASGTITDEDPDGAGPEKPFLAVGNKTLSADDEKYTTTTFGMKVDWNNIIAYAEMATVDMADFKAGEAETTYMTLGYQIDDWLPHVTYQTYEKNADEYDAGETHEQTITTFGVKYDLDRNTALKFEYSMIETDSGEGLFELDDAPPGTEAEDTTMMSIALDVVF